MVEVIEEDLHVSDIYWQRANVVDNDNDGTPATTDSDDSDPCVPDDSVPACDNTTNTDNDEDGTPATTDPDDNDPCVPDNTVTACTDTIDNDGDGTSATTDPDDNDPCVPDNTASACNNSDIVKFANEIRLFPKDSSKDRARLGHSVDMDGNTIIAGTDVSNVDVDSGSAYIIEKINGKWGFTTKLKASDGAADFGHPVAIFGDTAAVGAGEDFFVFERNHGGANNWGEVKKLEITGGTTKSVGISGDTIVVSKLGSLSIFERNEGGTSNWGKTKEISLDQILGVAVTIDNHTLVVCKRVRPYTSSPVSIFERDEGGTGNWGEIKNLLLDGDCSGHESVAIDEDILVIGDRGLPVHGAHIFERNEGGTNNWGQVKEIELSDRSFGYSVDVSGDVVVIGHYHGNNDPANSAFIFERNEGGTNNWGQVREVWASNEQRSEDFAHSVAVFGNTVAIGTPGDSNSGFSRSGAVFLYEHTPTTADNDNDGTLASDDPHDGDPCYPDDSVSNCNQVIDNDGDGLTVARGDQDDNDPCFPDDNVPACTGNVDNDGDGTPANTDPDDNDPCVPDNTVEACTDTIDNDGDGTSATTDPDDNDPCVPNNSVSACTDTIDEDNDGTSATTDPDDNDPCVPDNTASACNNSDIVKFANEIKLFPDDSSKDRARLGHSLDMDGNTIIAGTDVSNVEVDSGSAYIIEKINDEWVFTTKLKASDGAADFGHPVAIFGDTVAVGAGEDFFVFERNHGGTDNWGEVKKLELTGGTQKSVTIAEDTIVVGKLGLLSVFERNEGGANNWGKTKELPLILDDRISKISAAISGDTLVACTGYLYSITAQCHKLRFLYSVARVRFRWEI